MRGRAFVRCAKAAHRPVRPRLSDDPVDDLGKIIALLSTPELQPDAERCTGTAFVDSDVRKSAAHPAGDAKRGQMFAQGIAHPGPVVARAVDHRRDAVARFVWWDPDVQRDTDAIAHRQI